MPMKTADVVIIGGGIAGLALAVELKKRQVNHVVVVERNYIGSGGSGRNVGRIRSMQLTESLTRYAIHCQNKYEQMGETLGYNVLFWRAGYLWLLYEQEEVERMRPVVEMHHRLGVKSELLDPEGVYGLVDHLRNGEPVAGGVANGRDAIIHHDAVVWAYYETARKLGVEICQNTSVSTINASAGEIRSVQLGTEQIETPRVVNTAGAWSKQVAAMAGIEIPVTPVRREVLVTMPVKPFLNHAITFYRPTEGWFNQTLRGEIVGGVIDADEPAGINSTSSFDFLSRTASLLVRKMPALGELHIIRQWAGMYELTPDHLPLIGESDQVKGFYQANGWSGRGMLLSPFSMELLAEQIVNQTPQSLLEQFNPNRFTGREIMQELNPDYYKRYS